MAGIRVGCWNPPRGAKFRLLILGVFLTFAFALYNGVNLGQESDIKIICRCENDQKDTARSQEDAQGGKSDVKEQRDGMDQGQLLSPDKIPAQKLCILVPFRDRFEELLEFAPYIHRFLEKQQILHHIVVINQLDNYRFNRASLINVGYLESKEQCDYIAMHDVDLLPVNEELRYDFPEAGPHHLAAPHLHPLYHYRSYVGGILLLQNSHFEKLNGLSNKYWGWGREDDEFYVRMKKARLKLTRPGNLTTGYASFRHIHDRKKRPRDQNRYFDQREKTRRLDRETGISSVKYLILSKNELSIDGADVSFLNVQLVCDIKSTPWCLRAEDHDQYQKMVSEGQNTQQTLAPPLGKQI